MGEEWAFGLNIEMIEKEIDDITLSHSDVYVLIPAVMDDLLNIIGKGKKL